MTDIIILDDVTVKLIAHMGGDASIVQAARVSVQGENEIVMMEPGARDAGLINYLMREKHGSPFEAVVFKFYVKAPIFVFREFMRHRIASYNEISGRYSKLAPEFYIPNADRKLVNIGTSARPEFAPGTREQVIGTAARLESAYQDAWDAYEWFLEGGIANEVARMILPVGIMSQMYVTMNLRSIFNFLSLRIQDETAVHVSKPQREIEMVAQKMEAEVAKICPIAYKTFIEHGRVAP